MLWDQRRFEAQQRNGCRWSCVCCHCSCMWSLWGTSLMKGKNSCSWLLRFPGSGPSFCSGLLLILCSKLCQAKRTCIRIQENEKYCYSKSDPQVVAGSLWKRQHPDLWIGTCILRNPQGIGLSIKVCQTLILESWKMSYCFWYTSFIFSPPILSSKYFLFSPPKTCEEKNKCSHTHWL